MSEINPIYKELAARIPEADMEYIPRILEKLANLDQAKILLALPDKDRDPALGRTLKVSDKFAQNLNMDKATVEKHLQELYEKGVIFPTKVGPSMARTWMQLHDSTLSNPKYDKSLGKEFFELWEAAQSLPRKLPQVAMFRVVPKWQSIKDLPGVLPHEDLRQILKNQDTPALLHCGCKRSYPSRKCGVSEESCINIGRTAQYNLERGAGRKITYEEALKLLDEFDKYPVVNLVINQKEVNTLICNCHQCCCGAFIDKSVAKSRFLATVDIQKCRACKTCVARCQFEAAKIKFYPELGAERAYIDAELCTGCGDCIITCPSGARGMKIGRPPEYIPDALSIY